MALNFPSPASDGQSYTENGITYTYDGTYSVWKAAMIPVPDVFGTANAAFGVANAAFGVANAAFGVANAAFGNANSTLVVASAAFNNANSTLVVASAAFGKANTAGASVSRSTKTSTYNLVSGDKGNLIDATSGPFTITFDAATTLGSGWFVYIKNSSTEDVTLDPNVSETIDGLTSFIMYPGEMRLVQCDGSAFNSIVLNTFYKTFTSSGTFTKPPGYSSFAGLLWGAGGGGGKATDDTGSFHCGGGGGGSCLRFSIASSSFSNSQSFTIGTGGSGATVSNSPGGVGGTSSIGTLAYAYGGGGGNGSTVANKGGGGGGGLLSAGSSADTGGNAGGSGGRPFKKESSSVNNRPNDGFGGGAGADNNAQYGSSEPGDSVFGGGGGGTSNNPNNPQTAYGGAGGGGIVSGQLERSGGVSLYGGNGGNGSRTGTAGNGSAPGGGGGATGSGTAGAGGRGELRIWGVI